MAFDLATLFGTQPQDPTQKAIEDYARQTYQTQQASQIAKPPQGFFDWATSQFQKPAEVTQKENIWDTIGNISGGLNKFLQSSEGSNLLSGLTAYEPGISGEAARDVWMTRGGQFGEQEAATRKAYQDQLKDIVQKQETREATELEAKRKAALETFKETEATRRTGIQEYGQTQRADQKAIDEAIENEAKEVQKKWGSYKANEYRILSKSQNAPAIINKKGRVFKSLEITTQGAPITVKSQREIKR